MKSAKARQKRYYYGVSPRGLADEGYYVLVTREQRVANRFGDWYINCRDDSPMYICRVSVKWAKKNDGYDVVKYEDLDNYLRRHPEMGSEKPSFA